MMVWLDACPDPVDRLLCPRRRLSYLALTTVELKELAGLSQARPRERWGQ